MRRIVNIDSKLQSFCAGDVELKESAKRALMAYMRSIFLMSNKKIFNIENVDVAKFSSSLGLVVAPRIRFLKNNQKKELKPTLDNASDDDDDDESKPKKKIKEIKPNENDTFNFHANDDEFTFRVKKNSFNVSDEESGEDEDVSLSKNKIKVKTKASIVKQLKKKKIKVNEKVVFDDEGNVIIFSEKLRVIF